jgi:hypothetical protein
MPRGVLLRHTDDPRREVAGIDDLDRVRRRPRRQHLAAARDAHGPVGEPVRGILGAHDQPWPDHRRAAGEPSLRLRLAERLERPEEIAAAGPVRLHGLGHGIVARVLRDRRRLVHPGLTEAGERGDGRDVDVLVGVVPEERRGVPDPEGQDRGVVDHHVPLPAPESVQIVVAVAAQVLDRPGQVRLATTTVEHRDLVAPLHCIADLVGPDEAGSAEDEDAERARRGAVPAEEAGHGRGGVQARRAQQTAHRRHPHEAPSRYGHESSLRSSGTSPRKGPRGFDRRARWNVVSPAGTHKARGSAGPPHCGGEVGGGIVARSGGSRSTRFLAKRLMRHLSIHSAAGRRHGRRRW